MKTPKVGLGYHSFKRVVMRCRARDEKRQETCLPVTNPGRVERSPSSEEDVPGRGNPVALGIVHAVRGLAPTGCMTKGDPFGDTETGHGPGLTLSGSRCF